MKKIATIIYFLVAFFYLSQTAFAELNPSLKSKITFDSRNTRLEFFGQVPKESQVYLKIIGPVQKAGIAKHYFFNIPWLYVESVTISGLPSLFQVLGSNSIENLPDRLQKEMGIESDYLSLRENAEVLDRSDEKAIKLSLEEREAYLDQVIKGYEKNDLYCFRNEAVSIQNGTFKGTVVLPPAAPGGIYEATIYVVKDNGITDLISKKILFKENSPATLFSNITKSGGAAYGMMVTALSLAMGFIMVALGIGSPFKQK